MIKGRPSSRTAGPPHATPARRRAAERRIEIAGSPVTDADRHLFAAFDRQGLTPDERRARIAARVWGASPHATA